MVTLLSALETKKNRELQSDPDFVMGWKKFSSPACFQVMNLKELFKAIQLSKQPLLNSSLEVLNKDQNHVLKVLQIHHLYSLIHIPLSDNEARTEAQHFSKTAY